MARPKKNNAEYFTHDADMRNDVKIKAIRRKFKHTGYAIWCFLLEALADSDFFEIDWSDINIELFSADFDISPEELIEIVEYCVKIELFTLKDGKLFSETQKNRFNSLISKRERERGFVTKNSNTANENKAETSKKEVIAVDNPDIDNENPHSKVKESRVKKSKEDESKEKEIPHDEKKDFDSTLYGSRTLYEEYKDSDWLNGCAMNRNLSKKEIDEYFSQFENKLVEWKDTLKSRKDFCKHFSLWLDAMLKNNQARGRSSPQSKFDKNIQSNQSVKEDLLKELQNEQFTSS